MKNAKKKDYSAEDVTMMLIQFCQSHGLLNSHCNLSTIEYYRHRKNEAIEYLGFVINDYGTEKDMKIFASMFGMSTKKAHKLLTAR